MSQECPRRVSHKSVLQECHLDILVFRTCLHSGSWVPSCFVNLKSTFFCDSPVRTVTKDTRAHEPLPGPLGEVQVSTTLQVQDVGRARGEDGAQEGPWTADVMSMDRTWRWCNCVLSTQVVVLWYPWTSLVRERVFVFRSERCLSMEVSIRVFMGEK